MELSLAHLDEASYFTIDFCNTVWCSYRYHDRMPSSDKDPACWSDAGNVLPSSQH